MMPRGKNIHEHAYRDQRGAKPERHTVRLCRSSVLDYLELLQEETESSDDKTESHQRQTSADPRQERTLGRQKIPQLGLLLCLRWRIHFRLHSRPTDR